MAVTEIVRQCGQSTRGPTTVLAAK